MDPVPLTEEFTSLLGSVFEPAGRHPWLVDWLWVLYEAALQPFLCLAGPASDGTAVNSFREYWQSLPWEKATFHCISPGGHWHSHCCNVVQSVLIPNGQSYVSDIANAGKLLVMIALEQFGSVP